MCSSEFSLKESLKERIGSTMIQNKFQVYLRLYVLLAHCIVFIETYNGG